MSAKTAMEKAHDAYEKGLRTFASRREPIGYDRDHNAVYLFLSDPSIIFIESRRKVNSNSQIADRNLSTWHAVETKSIYDSYVSSLDKRGVRENALYEGLSSVGARKNLFDDVKELNDRKAAQRRLQDAERRLENARLAVKAEDESGRRSGRLASLAQLELAKVEEEIRCARAIAEEKTRPSPPPNYRSLTGLEILCDYDLDFLKRSLREIPNVKIPGYKSGTIPKHYPGLRGTEHLATPLWKIGGVIEVLVSELVELESWISSLAPRDKRDITLGEWTDGLREAVTEWKKITSHDLGPLNEEGDSDSDGGSKGNDADSSVNALTPLKRNYDDLRKPVNEIKELEELQPSVSVILESIKVGRFMLRRIC